MKNRITIILLCLSVSVSIGQTIDTYLPGIWKVKGKETYEKWESKAVNLITGYGYRKSGEVESITEKLKLVKDGECWSYEATVGNQNNGKPVVFEQNCENEGKWVFENLDHDFPKKIIYTPVSENKMLVEVLGDEDKGFSFYMYKVE